MIFFLMILPLTGWGQTKNVFHALRVVPKFDKIAEIEKAMTLHNQKFHMGEGKVRVFMILTGPDAGGYQITDGPYSWEAMDNMKDNTADRIDAIKNLAPLVQSYSSSFAVYREDLSTVQSTDYSDKIAITHVYPKIGRGGAAEESIKTLKKPWQDGKQNVAVYESSSSGPLQYILVSRYKEGWKERAEDFSLPFKDRYNKANGEGSYDKLLENRSNNTDHVWSEMLVYRPDLSSK